MINAQKNINVDTIEDFRSLIFPKELMNLSGSYDAVVTRCIDKGRPGWIKVNIFGITDDLPIKDQPWAEPPPTQNYQIPDAGAFVLVTFRDGDVHYPIWHSATSQNNGRYFPTHEYTEDYPNNHVLYNSNDGTIMKNNRKSGDFIIEHFSGTKVTIDKWGKVEVIRDGILGQVYQKSKVVTNAAMCPFLAAMGAPPMHPTGLDPLLSIDDIGTSGG